MAETGEYVYAELAILAGLGQVKSTEEMAIGAVVSTGIVGHPACHLSQSCGSGEDGRVFDDEVTAEEARPNLNVQILDHGGVQMAATDLPVGGPERLHCEHI